MQRKKVSHILFVMLAVMVVAYGVHLVVIIDSIDYTVTQYLAAAPDIMTSGGYNALYNDSFYRGVVIGGAFAFSITLLFFYMANGNKTVLLLFGYFVCQAILLAVLLGVPVILGSVDVYKVTRFDIPVLLIFINIFLLAFTNELFKLSEGFLSWYKVTRTALWLLCVYVPLSFMLTVTTHLYLGLIINQIVTVLLMVLAIKMVLARQRLATLYCIFLFIQQAFALLNSINQVWFDAENTINGATIYSFSFLTCSLVIAFLLSRGYYYQIKDKHIAEEQAMDSAMETQKAQQELLEAQLEHQEQLESTVQERTLELNIALQELELANKELEEKNTRDALTGLYNRRYYDQKIIAEHRRSRRNLTPLSIVIIDIDHFKKINDSLGHLAGDYCLKQVSGKIKQILGRSSDVAARYGGEEFCLILPETDMQGGVGLAEELRMAIAKQPFMFEGQAISITISCGVSTFTQQRKILPEHIFSAADKALYQAKNSGRNKVISLPIEHLSQNNEDTL